jgi:hypothetical protein
MKNVRPEILAVRAVNQYRRRDILPYLGLRYYLANHCALRDRWAGDVASHLVISRTKPNYFSALHFKEHQDGKQVEHRQMHLPGPNEAFAEAALLNECSKHIEAFQALPCVFSYRFAPVNSPKGIFETYFSGFRERHAAVANACRQNANGIVLYTDIKRFYPSITTASALDAWSQACNTAMIGEKFQHLGEKILRDQATVAAGIGDCAGILTGPMFSHLVGNLVLRAVDARMNEAMPGRYFRYVDDIILTGQEAQVHDGQARLAELLKAQGLHLHEHGGKGFHVEAAEWLTGEKDFEDDGRKPNWMTLVSGLKELLIAKTDARNELMSAFATKGMRFSKPDYSEAVMETWYLKGLLRRLKYSVARFQARKVTVAGLIHDAVVVRGAYANGLREQLVGAHQLDGYARKRRIPKLRFFAGRLTYLATPQMLLEFSASLKVLPELRLIAQVFRTIVTEDATELFQYGINAVQAAAQVLRLTSRPVRCQPSAWQKAEIQGLAILRLNGVTVDTGSGTNSPDDELNRFALWDHGSELMKSEEPFIRELACLHGVDDGCRHASMLDSAFDRDEQLAFDAIAQLQPSSYF